MSAKMEFTGERFVPQVHGTIELEHMHRYLMACEIASGKDVLDIACGEGYGSARMAQFARQVYGVDISAEAVAHAKAVYAATNVRFMEGSCETIPLPDNSVDLVVSFETIEHHDKHDEMMLEIKRVLRPGGVLIISTPDKQTYSIETNYQNPYHVKELLAQEFKDLLSKHFTHSEHFGQKITYGSSILLQEGSSPQKTYWNDNDRILSTDGSFKPLYILSIVSDSPLPMLASGIYVRPESESETASSLRWLNTDQIRHIACLDQTISAQDTHITDLKAELARLQHIVNSAISWQRRSWFKRAFHKWRTPDNGEEKALHDSAEDDHVGIEEADHVTRLTEVIKSQPTLSLPSGQQGQVESGPVPKPTAQDSRISMPRPDTDRPISGSMENGITIIIPLYKTISHLRAVGESLCGISEELGQVNAHVVLIDDSPGFEEHAQVILELAKLLNDTVSVDVLLNGVNKGFLRSANCGLQLAIELGNHALLLNSDTVVFPGAIREMLAGFDFDPMVGFVSPRSNNATLCSLPSLDLRVAQQSDLTPTEHSKNHADLSKSLPQFSFVPTAVGFAMLIRRDIIAELGLLDEIYGQGYEEENDLVMRANRLGFRAILANRAFIYHEGSASFTSATTNELKKKNTQVIQGRYPEYQAAVRRHFRAPGTLGEAILSERSVRSNRGRTIEVAVDARNLTGIINGTSRVVVNIVNELAKRSQGTPVRISVVCSQFAASFHLLDNIPNITLLRDEQAYGFDVWLDDRQPFSLNDFWDASRRAVKVAFTMHDVIAWDCSYLCSDELDPCWRMVGELSDALFFVSPFSEALFRRRFSISPQVRTAVTSPSLNSIDYPHGPRVADAVRDELKILVFGNHFHHKFVVKTVDVLAKQFPERPIVQFGVKKSANTSPNVQCMESGELTDLEMENVFAAVGCVVFPSFYEGFGLPIVESLARGLQVYVRDSELNRWIRESWNGPGQLRIYQSTADLLQRLTFGHDSSQVEFERKIEPNGYSWNDTGERLWNVLQELALDQNQSQFWRRLDQMHLVESHTTRVSSSSATGNVLASLRRRKSRTPFEFIRDFPKRTIKEIRRFAKKQNQRAYKLNSLK
jgi:GT2 family glycosyltransferase/SAM-dependent methyltransferase